MLLIETLQVGPRHAGHSRTIYAGSRCELWHEVMIPWNPLRSMRQRAELYVERLPSEAPDTATFCGMVSQFYRDGLVPMIKWEGDDCFEHAMAYIRSVKSLDLKPEIV